MRCEKIGLSHAPLRLHPEVTRSPRLQYPGMGRGRQKAMPQSMESMPSSAENPVVDSLRWSLHDVNSSMYLRMHLLLKV